MTGISAVAGSVGPLSARLMELADVAAGAASHVRGDMINPQVGPSIRAKLIENAAFRASSAADSVNALTSEIEQAAGDAGVQLAWSAARDLRTGASDVAHGVTIEDDFVRDGAIHTKPDTLTGAAAKFDEAARQLRDVSALARIHETPVDELFGRIAP